MGKPIDSMTRNRKRHTSGIRRYFACCILNLQAELLESSGGVMIYHKKLASGCVRKLEQTCPEGRHSSGFGCCDRGIQRPTRRNGKHDWWCPLFDDGCGYGDHRAIRATKLILVFYLFSLGTLLKQIFDARAQRVQIDFPTIEHWYLMHFSRHPINFNL